MRRLILVLCLCFGMATGVSALSAPSAWFEDEGTELLLLDASPGIELNQSCRGICVFGDCAGREPGDPCDPDNLCSCIYCFGFFLCAF